MSAESQASAAPAKPRPSRVKRTLLMAALPVVLLAGAGAWWMTTGGSESTDNAYVHQARLSVASEIGGRVVTIAVAENQPVAKGDLLFQVDPEPYRIALRKAEVGLDSARLDVQRLKAAYAQAVAQARMAHDTVDYENTNLTRQNTLTTKGVAADSSLDDARHAQMVAEQTATAADMAVKAALAALGGNPDAAVDEHPEVRTALVARDAAARDLAHTEVRAPADGIVYQAAAFRLGQMVGAGATLFTLVETGDTWIEANFKETQLGDIRVGQPVEVKLDVNRKVKLEGRVEAIGAGTGSEFSLLPAQNATGNWVKVEQRVPVRIRLDDPSQAAVLASGLSAEVTVDTADQGHDVATASAAPVGAAQKGTLLQ
ncbi:MAG: HlyD family secretion protein [Paracoccaceae bacterium]